MINDALNNELKLLIMKTIMKLKAIAIFLLAFNVYEINGMTMVNISCQYETTLKKATTKTFKVTKWSGKTKYAVYGEDNECYPDYSQNKLFGSGTATQIGNFNLEIFFCVNKEGLSESPWAGSMTVANGDQIQLSIAEPLITNKTDENGIWHIEYNIVGGTGTYENATGSIKLLGSIDFENSTWEFTGEGSITY